MMKIENGKIIEATEKELYDYWLERFEEIMSFTDYLYCVQANGTKVIYE